MPRYKSRTRKPAKKKAPKLPKKKGKFTRDPRKLLRWAARGSHDDYERLRALAKKARAAVPAYIDSAAYDKLTTVNSRRPCVRTLLAHFGRTHVSLAKQRGFIGRVT